MSARTLHLCSINIPAGGPIFLRKINAPPATKGDK